MKYALCLWLLLMACDFCFAQQPGQQPAQPYDFSLEGIPSHAVPATFQKMTNLVFPVGVKTGVKVSKAILAQKVKGVDNVIELKALRRNFPTTNLSVYGWDGRLYSFIIYYTDDSSVLNYRVIPSFANLATPARGHMPGTSAADPLIHLTGLPVDRVALSEDASVLARKKGFMHISTRNERMRLTLKGIYIRDSLQWMVFSLSNGSRLGYTPDHFRIFYQDKKQVKRTASQQVEIIPVYGYDGGLIVGRTKESFAMGFAPFTIEKNKKLIVEVSEPEGGRTLVLKVTYKELLRAENGDSANR